MMVVTDTASAEEGEKQWIHSRFHAYWTLSSWSCVLIRLLESRLISICCSFWLKLSSFLNVASSLSDDCSTTRRSRISVLSTYKVENKEAVTISFLPPSNRHIKIHVNKSFTFCSLQFRLKTLLQLTDSVLQVELFLVPVSSLIRQYLRENNLENRSVKGTTLTQLNFKFNRIWQYSRSMWNSTSSLRSHSCDNTDICSSSFEICCNSLLFFNSSSLSCVWTWLACSWK